MSNNQAHTLGSISPLRTILRLGAVRCARKLCIFVPMRKILTITAAVLLIALPGRSQQRERIPGSVFYENMRELSFEDREQAIWEQFQNCNFPEFLIQFVQIDTTLTDAQGTQRHVTFYVSPDYLSIGTEDDYFIIPLGPKTAQKIADRLDASLPTPMVVDMVYEKSILKLEPFNFIPRGIRNITPDILYDHSKIVQAQRRAAGHKPGVFVAGTKKDIVISGKLADTVRTRHVTIYGWHKLDGIRIQPVTNIHIDTYVDYSHGARLISNKVLIDGQEYDYRRVLQDPLLHTLLNNEPTPLVKTTYCSSKYFK